MKNMKNIKKHIPTLLLLAFTVSFLSACSKETPIGSLTSSTLSQKYDKAFWQNEQKNNTALWKQAQQTCNFMSPNCGVIATLNNESFAR